MKDLIEQTAIALSQWRHDTDLGSPRWDELSEHVKSKYRDQAKAALKVATVQIRTAVADYMQSEGCGCCRDTDAHEQHQATLGKLLAVPKYKDGSGYDFGKFQSKK